MIFISQKHRTARSLFLYVSFFKSTYIVLLTNKMVQLWLLPEMCLFTINMVPFNIYYGILLRYEFAIGQINYRLFNKKDPFVANYSIFNPISSRTNAS